MRKRCASISAVISNRSKPASRLQSFCFSSIRKRRIRSCLCVAASALTRMHLRRRQLVASTYAIILRTSRSWKGMFLSDEKKSQCLELVFTGLQNSRFLGDNGSRDTPPIDTSSALSLSFAALSIGGVWAMMFYGTIQLFRCSPQLFFRLGS